MKRYLHLGWVLLIACLLASCTYKNTPYLQTDLTREKWMQEVDSTPDRWVIGADRWFLAGEPNMAERENMDAPVDDAISTMMVRVPDNFINIQTEGDFQVQVFGSDSHNSVYIYGPNSSVRDVVVRVSRDTIYLSQSKKSKGLHNVIVRIGMRNLRNLVHSGCGTVEGRLIHSDGLFVTSLGKGNIYLSGCVNLKRMMVRCSGSISVFGANTPDLDIITEKEGSANVSGNIGVHTITHRGTGCINIIGANTRDLKIYAEGHGKIGINGQVGMKEITAKGKMKVYAYYVASDSLYVNATDWADVGLAGSVQHLYVDAKRSSMFWGRCLFANDAYVRAHNGAHINVRATNKIFAAASEYSSVYYFGTPDILSQFIANNGVIIPIWGNDAACPGFQPMCGMKDEVGEEIPRMKRRHSYKGI